VVKKTADQRFGTSDDSRRKKEEGMRLGHDVSAVVTGGASGLGAATARALAAKGAKVGVLDLDEDAGGRIAQEIGATFAKCDVTSEPSVQVSLSAVRNVQGQERILVNCAGIAAGKRIARRVRETGAVEPHDLATFVKAVQVNLVGTFLMISNCAAGMLSLEALPPDGERGVLIMTSSVAAEDGQMGQVAYAASKGGVAAMTLPVARDLARDGIRVCSILPGLFRTPMFASLPEEARKSLEAVIPFPARLGDPAEYAMLAMHICENVMLNGVCLRLDGAIRLAPK
jgi:NAD(P)-dependent dehydrogenase (short-subunit alcohol dehydrogenase family)